MGIKHLWAILAPFCERKPLYELQKKTVAVDLSCWICEAQNIAEYQVQPRMYLRNLYFRTCYLLLLEVNPVYILEGKAPELKYHTIAARNDHQFKGAKPKTDGVKTGKDRTRFHFVLKQCEEMLGYMGLICIKGKGEAESLCAYLNEDGLVDGCISQDSDCFAYGAKVVYRNFSISAQGSYSASGGAVDVYDITKAYKSINFGRNKIIAMALLCGSDYSEGVLGIGKESVIKFFEKLSDEAILDRLRSWRLKPGLYEEFEKQISDKNICTSCGHHGKIQSHTKNGCNPCGTTKGCDPFKFKEERLQIKNEINMRNKALQDPNFPDENLVNEFLVKKDNISVLDLKWKQPDMVNFIKFTTKFLQWEEIYAFEKMLPILTRWQCLNHDLIKQPTSNMKGILCPDKIKKARNPKGIPSYEIIWTDPNEYFKGLIPECQLMEHKVDPEKLWSTIEPRVLVQNAYPELVEAYKQSKIKPKKVSKRKKKSATVEDINEMLENTSISQPLPKKTKKSTKHKVTVSDENKKTTRRKPTRDVAFQDLEGSFSELKIDNPKQKTLDTFLKTAIINNHNKKAQKSNNIKSLETEAVVLKENNCQSSTPNAKNITQNISFDFNMSNFGDEDDLELSDIVEDIISRKKTPDYIKQNINKIALDIFENNSNQNDANSSSFFMTNPVENDLFEKTFSNIDDDDESTEEYEADENDFLDRKADEFVDEVAPERGDKSKENEDSFCDNYVPLYERLKRK